jgi:hypothetical protein
MNTTCQHTSTNIIRTRGYTAPVSVYQQNPAAHGNVEYVVECGECGARRSELHNGCHVELGPWGPDRAARKQRVERLSKKLPPLPPPVLIKRADGESATLTPDEEGGLVIQSSAGVSQREQEALGAYYPHLQGLVARRQALLELEAARAEV